MKKLCLVDGSGFIFRAFHALPPLHTKDGTPVNAVYGFSKAMMALQNRKDIDYIAVVFDSSRITFRQDIYKEYKAHRPPAPEDLVPQFALLRDVVRALNIPQVERDGFEADDIIATYAARAKKKGIAVEIQSSDKDLMQLIDDSKNVYMFDPLKKKTIKEFEVNEKFGVLPKDVIFVQALMGDSSDNVPGVKGVGPKTAMALIQEFGNIEEIYKNIDNIPKENLKNKLITDKDLAFISLDLVTLKTDVPLDIMIEDLTFQHPIPEDLYKFFISLSFTSMATKVALDANLDMKSLSNISGQNNLSIHNEDSQNKVEYLEETIKDVQNIFIKTVEELNKNFSEDSLKSLEQNLEVAFLFAELNNNTFMVSIFDKVANINYNFEALYQIVDDSMFTLNQNDEILLVEIIKKFKFIFEATHIKKIFFNLKPFLKILRKEGINLASYEDIMLMSYLLDGVILNKDPLRHILVQNFMIPEAQEGVENIDDILYAHYLINLYSLYQRRIISEKSNYVYEVFDKPLLNLLSHMEEVGITVDKRILQDLSNKFEATLKETQESIFKIAGEEFNLASPKQIGDILFDKMEIKGKKNKSGSWKTSASFLEDLAEDGVEIASLILIWRQLFKLKTTYTDSLIKKINPLTGRVHTTYLQCQTSTGRLSSIDPNLQNIPIRSTNGKEIRKSFVAKAGYKIISLDYSQIELRILAIIGNVHGLLESFKQGEDIHKKTASEIFDIPLNEVNEDFRRKAKAINFGIIYGQTQHGLAAMLGVHKNEAQEYIDSYFVKYPEIKNYMDETLIFARKNGFVPTLFGRRCFLKEINHKNYVLRSLAERAAINARIQGTSADIMRRSMIKAHDILVEGGYDGNILLQIHDEILVEVIESQAEDLAKILQKEMASIFNLLIPLDVNYAIGNNWLDSH